VKRQLRVLAPPNADLAVDRLRRVYKSKAEGWVALNYWLPADALLLVGRRPAIAVEVSR
jgi:hypothetical protein